MQGCTLLSLDAFCLFWAAFPPPMRWRMGCATCSRAASPPLMQWRRGCTVFPPCEGIFCCCDAGKWSRSGIFLSLFSFFIGVSALELSSSSSASFFLFCFCFVPPTFFSLSSRALICSSNRNISTLLSVFLRSQMQGIITQV